MPTFGPECNNMEKLRKFCEFRKVYSEAQETGINKEFKRLEGE